MSSFSEFIPVEQYFHKGRSTGKIIDQVVFAAKDFKLDDIPSGSLVIFSLQHPSLSDITDTLPLRIRKRFFDLFLPAAPVFQIYDLGILYANDSGRKTLTNVTNALVSKKITTIILSSQKEVHTLLYKGLEKALKSVCITEASTILPFGEGNPKSKENTSWLKEVISKPGNKLFNFSNLGMQGFMNPLKNQDLFRKLLFDSIRMGSLQQDMTTAEPVVRDSDLFIFDMNVVKASDAPAVLMPNPNGLSGFDACRFARFAGTSERMKIFCVDNMAEQDDGAMITSFLMAQMLWFFTEAYYGRIPEQPKIKQKEFNTFVVETEHEGSFVFLQSRISDRWWVQIESLSGKKMTISCLKKDYLDMTLGEIPERLMKYLNKIA